jgi:hypothetical protein
MDELYDLRHDPFEMSNVIHKPDAGATLQSMVSELSRLLLESR